ncbi:hypothetical protein [Methylocystis echinoides]|jgi:hypothetical protein|uniref:hypothetical protein n=1 Tax=Methylocystis echinoides TaxID=29468 RepID=UPI00344642D6
MTFDSFTSNPAPRRMRVRNPANLMIERQNSSAAIHPSAFVAYLEAVWLACVIVAVAGVVPLVMLLHR